MREYIHDVIARAIAFIPLEVFALISLIGGIIEYRRDTRRQRGQQQRDFEVLPPRE